MKATPFFLIFFISICAFCQEPVYQPNKRFGPVQLQSDFNLLIKSMKEVHPDVNAFNSKDHLNAVAKSLAENLSDSLTEEEFHVLVRQFVREVRCGHTMAKPSEAWYSFQRNDSKLLPLNVVILNDQLFIREAFDQDSILKPGLEIVSIDDRPTAEILAQMRKVQEVDGWGTSFETRKIERSFSTYFLFLYGRSDQYDIAFLDSQGKMKRVQVTGGKFKSRVAKAAAVKSPLSSMQGAELYMLSDSLAVLDINSFYRKGFRKFYKSVFEQLANAEVNHLVLDLRNNGGGYFPNGNRLLGYFLEEDFVMAFNRPRNSIDKSHLDMPFWSKLTKRMFSLMPDKDREDPKRNYHVGYKSISKNAYRGNLYVLIDGGTFSMGSLVAAQLRHQSKATFLGGETGGGEEGSNAIIKYKLTLPETKVRVMIPYFTLDHQVKAPTPGRGVMPDFEIKYNFEEILKGRDKELERVNILMKQDLSKR